MPSSFCLFVCSGRPRFGWTRAVLIAPSASLSDLDRVDAADGTFTPLTLGAFGATLSGNALAATAHIFILTGSRPEIQAALAHAKKLDLLRRPYVDRNSEVVFIIIFFF
jgi:hypothetical protein